MTISAGTISFNSGMSGCLMRGSTLTINGSADVSMTAHGNELDFYALKFVAKASDVAAGKFYQGLTVADNATLTVETKGTTYDDRHPIALYSEGSQVTVQNSGTLIAKSTGQSNNADCQGYGIWARSLEIADRGTVMAWSEGKKKNSSDPDGNEAIYVNGKLTVGSRSEGYTGELGARLYAKTNQTDSNYIGALFVREWNLQSYQNDEFVNNFAVITLPANGHIPQNGNFIIEGDVYKSAREVELCSIHGAELLLGTNSDGATVSRYRSSTRGDTEAGFLKYTGPLDLKIGTSDIGKWDYEVFYGVQVQSGTHTIVLDNFARGRDHAYITVHSGATLNLQLKGISYLENSANTDKDAFPVITVEKGGTLNIIGDSNKRLSTALTVVGGIGTSDNGSGTPHITFKDCIVYAPGTLLDPPISRIGGDDAEISVENCWMKVGGYLANTLTVKNSTVESSFLSFFKKLVIDNISSARITAWAPTAVDPSGTPVYRTEITLEDMQTSTYTADVLYQLEGGSAKGAVWYKIAGLRLKNGTTSKEYNDLSMLMTDKSEKIVLWLPEGTETENVYGFNYDSGAVEGFVHDRGDGDAVVTAANHQNTGKLVLRDLLLGKGILAFRGTAEKDNTMFCAGYTGDTSDSWIAYKPENDIKLQGDAKWGTGFGLRVLTAQDGSTLYGSKAEVKLNNLRQHRAMT